MKRGKRGRPNRGCPSTKPLSPAIDSIWNRVSLRRARSTAGSRPSVASMVKDNRAAEGARTALFAGLRRERVVNAGRWTRDELYDDAP